MLPLNAPADRSHPPARQASSDPQVNTSRGGALGILRADICQTAIHTRVLKLPPRPCEALQGPCQPLPGPTLRRQQRMGPHVCSRRGPKHNARCARVCPSSDDVSTTYVHRSAGAQGTSDGHELAQSWGSSFRVPSLQQRTSLQASLAGRPRGRHCEVKLMDGETPRPIAAAEPARIDPKKVEPTRHALRSARTSPCFTGTSLILRRRERKPEPGSTSEGQLPAITSSPPPSPLDKSKRKASLLSCSLMLMHPSGTSGTSALFLFFCLSLPDLSLGPLPFR